jgi:hypothetical protein
MAGVFDDDIATAQELIAEFGQDCLWQKPAPVDDDSVPGYPTVGDLPPLIPVKIAFFSGRDLNRGTYEFLALMPGMEVPDNGEVGLLAGGLSFEPELTDTFIRGTDPDGAHTSVDKLDRLAPNGTPILYYVQVAA